METIWPKISHRILRDSKTKFNKGKKYYLIVYEEAYLDLQVLKNIYNICNY